MPKFSEFINFLNKNLNKDISKEDKTKILEKFYPNIQNQIYWKTDANIRGDGYTFEGIIDNDEYKVFKEFMKKNGKDFIICFHAFDDEIDVELNEIEFTKDKDIIIQFLDSTNQDYSLMDHINEN